MASRYCCYLSTVASKEANAAAVVDYLAAVIAAVSASTVETDVFVQVADGSRRSFLDHAQSIYNAALELSATAAVSVIPVTAHAQPTLLEAPCKAPAPGPPAPQVATLTKAGMRSLPGFDPVYGYAAVGGTFDHLHSGHKLLLTTAALHAADKLRVGVTDAELLSKKKFAQRLQTLDERKRHVVAFLQKLRSDLELEVDTITEVSGGTDRIAAVEALVMSPETEPSLPLINELRAKNGIHTPLVGVKIPFVQTSDGKLISSTVLREKMQSQSV